MHGRERLCFNNIMLQVRLLCCITSMYDNKVFNFTPCYI